MCVFFFKYRNSRLFPKLFGNLLGVHASRYHHHHQREYLLIIQLFEIQWNQWTVIKTDTVHVSNERNEKRAKTMKTTKQFQILEQIAFWHFFSFFLSSADLPRLLFGVQKLQTVWSSQRDKSCCSEKKKIQLRIIKTNQTPKTISTYREENVFVWLWVTSSERKHEPDFSCCFLR